MIALKNLALLFFAFWIHSGYANECPQISQTSCISVDQGSKIYLTLTIPETNIILFYAQKLSISTVYFADISGTNEEIINIIQPEFTIKYWIYLTDRKQILALNVQKILLVNPYTLKVIEQYEIPEAISFSLVEGTNYIIILMIRAVINIMDLSTMKIVKTLDCQRFPLQYGSWQFQQKFRTLKDGTFIVLITGQYGLFNWIIDLDTLDFSYNGYILQDEIYYGLFNQWNDGYRIEEHPTKDIDLYFAVGGGNIIVTFEIEDIQTRKYKLWDASRLNVNSQLDVKYFENPNPMLITQQWDCLYKWDISIDFVLKTVTYLNKDTPTRIEAYQYIADYTFQELLYLKDQNIILSGSEALFNWNVSTNVLSSYFGYISPVQRRFKYEENEQNIFFTLVPKSGSPSSIQYFDRKTFSKFLFENLLPNNGIEADYSISSSSNSGYRVKKCTNCFVFKQGNTSIFYTHIYPTNSGYKIYNMTTQVQLQWSQVSENIDPYFYGGSTWVPIGFPGVSPSTGTLFYLLNLDDLSHVDLKIPSDSQYSSYNSNISSFAMASLDILDNQELIGVDLVGNIYFWEIASPYTFKTLITLQDCVKSSIGDIFHYNTQKWIIVACGNNEIFVYDVKGKKQSILSDFVAVTPKIIRTFNDPNLLIVGGYENGIIYIYKFNEQNLLFEFLMTLSPGSTPDNVIWVEILNDNTLWIQYEYSNKFFEIEVCLADLNKCTNCEFSNYYSVKNVASTTTTTTAVADFGQGTKQSPFVTSKNIYSQIQRANMYHSVVTSSENIKARIISNPNAQLDLYQNFFNFTFSSVISLQFESDSSLKNANISASQPLTFEDYNSITFQGVDLYFNLTSQTAPCLVNFTTIETGATLNRVTMYNSHFKKSCFQVNANAANLTLTNLQIKDTDFSNNDYTFDISESAIISIKGLLIENCKFKDGSPFIKSSESLNATLEDITLLNNSCDTTIRSDVTQAFFAAGLFNVKSASISNNEFCNKILFYTMASSTHTNQTFSFENIAVTANTFLATSPSVFFDSTYSMNTNPDHALIILNSNFTSNSLLTTNQNTFTTSSIIGTTKIANVTLTNIHFIDHSDLSFGTFSDSEYSQLISFNCSNTLPFYTAQSLTTDNSNSCFTFSEFQQCSMNLITVDYKKIKDASLISLSNTNNKDTIVQISNSAISHLYLYQTKKNKYVNPIMVDSTNALSMRIDSCTFHENQFEGLSYSLVYGTNAMYIENYLGSIVITHSTFTNSRSNSKFNFIYASSNSLQIIDSNFASSAFSPEFLTTNIIEGGFLRAKINSLEISDSNFKQSFANIGAFLYLESFLLSMLVRITSTTFSEGFAIQDGGAFYIDSSDSQLTLTCDSCKFTNIYTMTTLAASFAFKDQAVTSSTKSHQLTFNQGQIKNIFGEKDNFFISVKRANVQFTDIVILTDSSQPQSDMFKNGFEATSYYRQQGYLAKALAKSNVNITHCSILGLKTQLDSSTLPVLVYASSSNVNLTKVTFQDSNFTRAAIEVINGNLILEKSTFSNLQKIVEKSKTSTSRRLLMEANTPATTASSLIILSSSQLSSTASNFKQINCLSSCNGAILQLLSSNFAISSNVFESSSAYFGGAVFVQGTHDKSVISDSQFLQNKAQNDGGAIYFQALASDVFDLQISNSQFIKNNATTGQGGAMFIRSAATSSTVTENQLISIESSIIKSNVAQVGGGVNFETIKPTISQSTKFIDNKGTKFGSDKVSYPSHLELNNPTEYLTNRPQSVVRENKLILNEFQSGSSLNVLDFMMESEDNEKIIPLNSEVDSYSVTVAINDSSQDLSKLNLRGDTTVQYTKDGFSFTDLVFVGVPGQSASLTVKSSQIRVYNDSTSTYSSDYTYQIDLNLRECISGEIINSYGVYTECSKCKQGTYTFDTDQCYSCLIGATCAGGDSILPIPGYWQRDEKNINIIQCSNQPSNCEGGSPGNISCFEGHIGALCEECDIYGEHWGKGYAKSGKYGCVDCDEISFNIVVVVLIVIWAQLTLYFAIKADIDILEQRAATQMIQKHFFRRSTRNNEVKSITKSATTLHAKTPLRQTTRSLNSKFENQSANKASIFIKMLTNYFFIVGQISTFNLSIPTGIVSMPSSIGQPLQQTMNSLDCALRNIDSRVPIIYLRLMFSALIPLVYLVIFIAGQAVMFYLRKVRRKFPYYIISTASIFMILYVQPDLVTQAVALISCRQIGDKTYILSNVSFECMTDEYKNYSLFFLTPLLILLVIVIPITLFSLIKKHKKSLETSSIKLKYGFLYKEYKQNAFYWEFVKMIEKLTIILTLNFYSQQIVTKGILVFLEISIYSILSMLIKPFREEEVNRIDVHSTNVCAVTVLLAIFLYKNEFDYFVYTSIVMIIAINIWFLQMIIRKLLRAYAEKFSDLLTKLRDKLPIISILFKPKPVRRTFRPELKHKLLSISQTFTKMTSEDKKRFVIDLVNSQLGTQHPRVFENKQEISQRIIQSQEYHQQLAASERIAPKQSARENNRPEKHNSTPFSNENLRIVDFQTDNNLQLITFENDSELEQSRTFEMVNVVKLENAKQLDENNILITQQQQLHMKKPSRGATYLEKLEDMLEDIQIIETPKGSQTKIEDNI